jgi:hypothetical protein
MAWLFVAAFGGASGLAGMIAIRTAGGRLRGQWLALLGIVIAALVPAFSVSYVVWDQMR